MCLFATFHIVRLSQQRMECIIQIKGWKSKQYALQPKHDVKMKDRLWSQHNKITPLQSTQIQLSLNLIVIVMGTFQF